MKKIKFFRHFLMLILVVCFLYIIFNNYDLFFGHYGKKNDINELIELRKIVLNVYDMENLDNSSSVNDMINRKKDLFNSAESLLTATKLPPNNKSIAINSYDERWTIFWNEPTKTIYAVYWGEYYKFLYEFTIKNNIVKNINWVTINLSAMQKENEMLKSKIGYHESKK